MWGKELNKSLSDLKASNPVEEETEKFRMSITRKFIGQAPITTAASKASHDRFHVNFTDSDAYLFNLTFIFLLDCCFFLLF